MIDFKLAIDGPAGAGKSTIAKQISRELEIDYVDTGAIYRALTYKALNLGIDLNNSNLYSFIYDTKIDYIDNCIFLDDKDVTDVIRENYVSNNVSQVAAQKEVRDFTVKLLKQIAMNKSVVMDGRDIGYNVLPNADLKIYLTASIEERAKRRFIDNKSRGIETDFELLKQEIKNRDEYDQNRKYAPLKKAEDAVVLNTSDMTVEEVIKFILKMVNKRRSIMEFSMQKVRQGKIVEGKVVQVTDNEVLLDIQSFTEGTIYKNYLTLKDIESCKEIVKEGDILKAKVSKVDDEKGLILLNCIDTERRNNFKEMMEKDGQKIEVVVKKIVKGGLICANKGVEMFMPESHIDFKKVDKEQLINKKFEVKIIETDEKKRRIVISRKLVIREEERKLAKEELAKLEVDQVVEGTVVRIADYGAFVSVGHLEGLVHISQLSHYKVDKVEEVLKVGDTVEAKIIKIQKNKVGLSLKALQETPWELFQKDNKIGDKVVGKVVKKMQFGMLIEVARDVVGMIHRNDYSWDPQENLAGSVEIGDELEVKILTIDVKNKKMQLSKKHLVYNPWQDVTARRGDVLSGKVVDFQENGALVEVQGVNAFLPVNEIETKRIDKAEDVLNLEQIITVEVMKIYPKDWKMIVSSKVVKERESRQELDEMMSGEETVSSSTTLGELFGDKLKNIK